MRTGKSSTAPVPNSCSTANWLYHEVSPDLKTGWPTFMDLRLVAKNWWGGHSLGPTWAATRPSAVRGLREGGRAASRSVTIGCIASVVRRLGHWVMVAYGRVNEGGRSERCSARVWRRFLERQ